MPPPAHWSDTTISEITGQPVNTWSEEWRAECEARAVLAMSSEARDAFFNGDKEAGQRGVIAVRCQHGAEIVRSWMEKLIAARQGEQ
ncbi:DUF7696 family protein [Microvirga rosea]|uniref:DUF7696 family protein n=1 Tax=Microvirga rosea TaxID=2715425 RepID=UPI001D0BD736|nr:hypothetical protein [Microvirga rosea]MCB8823138.1 hypothetical protein [Microvirga rosea]